MQKRPEITLTLWRENCGSSFLGIDLDCLPCKRVKGINLRTERDTIFVGCTRCGRSIHGVPTDVSRTIGFTYNGYDISVYYWKGYWDFVGNQDINDATAVH